MSKNDWARAHDALKRAVVVPIPKGWITVPEYARMEKISTFSAQARLAKMCEANVAERKRHVGFGRPRFIYRPKLRK